MNIPQRIIIALGVVAWIVTGAAWMGSGRDVPTRRDGGLVRPGYMKEPEPMQLVARWGIVMGATAGLFFACKPRKADKP